MGEAGIAGCANLVNVFMGGGASRNGTAGFERRGEAAMTYRLSRLAPGSYDVLLNGVIVASLVRSGETSDATWTAELLTDLPAWKRPAPFREAEHSFGSLEEARDWLGHAEIRDAGGEN
jgi:hypothetical protein